MPRRSMSEASLAYLLQLTCGPITAPSKSKPTMIRILYESKYISTGFLPYDCYQRSADPIADPDMPDADDH